MTPTMVIITITLLSMMMVDGFPVVTSVNGSCWETVSGSLISHYSDLVCIYVYTTLQISVEIVNW